jgi:hypothetical protein
VAGVIDATDLSRPVAIGMILRFATGCGTIGHGR